MRGERGRERAAIGPLIAFAAAMAHGRLPAARRALVAARRAGVGRVAAEETALMLMLHAGYPAALEGARVYGSAYARLRQNVARLHPDLATWMI